MSFDRVSPVVHTCFSKGEAPESSESGVVDDAGGSQRLTSNLTTPERPRLSELEPVVYLDWDHSKTLSKSPVSTSPFVVIVWLTAKHFRDGFYRIQAVVVTTATI